MTVQAVLDDAITLLPCRFCGNQPVKRLYLPEGVESGDCGCVTSNCPIEDVDFTFKQWNLITEPPMLMAKNGTLFC